MAMSRALSRRSCVARDSIIAFAAWAGTARSIAAGNSFASPLVPACTFLDSRFRGNERSVWLAFSETFLVRRGQAPARALDRLRRNQHECDHARHAAAIHPVVDGAALHQHIAGLEPDR